MPQVGSTKLRHRLSPGRPAPWVSLSALREGVAQIGPVCAPNQFRMGQVFEHPPKTTCSFSAGVDV